MKSINSWQQWHRGVKWRNDSNQLALARAAAASAAYQKRRMYGGIARCIGVAKK